MACADSIRDWYATFAEDEDVEMEKGIRTSIRAHLIVNSCIVESRNRSTSIKSKLGLSLKLRQRIDGICDYRFYDVDVIIIYF